MTETYRIGPLLLDVDGCVLAHAGTPLPLGRRAVAVLATLVQAAPEYVSKARIMEAAWPGVIVEESNLAVQISSIRRALATVSAGESWLQTLPGRGYRFVGPVSRVPEKATPATDDGDARSNLPQPLTSFIGREREVAELQELLSRNRLVTLTGTGGIGKTRLATCVAGVVVNRYSDGAWLVELGALRDPELVPQAAVNAFGLKEQPGRTLDRTLTEYLKTKHLMLVLDNAEHMLEACAELADSLLRQCPNVTILATSRERLAVPGELTYRVPSLRVPDFGSDIALQRLLEYESVRLFMERALLHVPSFALTDENAAAIANICRRLDGIALAIELAAARVRSMSPREINQRLDQRFDLLSGASRSVPPRQQTLRGAIDWSYDLLSETEKKLFCTVSVFAGGFTAEAAERVCGDEEGEAQQVLNVLTSLADKSLVVVEERAGASRYRLLETVHHYATERLRALGNEGDWHRRHLAHFFRLAEEAEPRLTGQDQQTWLDRLDTEHDNVRVALSRAIGGADDRECALRLASALSRFWLVRGYLAEGRGWLSRLLSATPDADPATRAKALNWAGVLAWKQGDYAAAKALYEQSLSIRRALHDRRGVGAVLNNQGLLAYEQGDYRAARRLHEESLAIDRELGDRWGIAVSLIHLASLATMQGDYQAARALNEESLAIFRALGDRGHVANALRSLGSLCSHEGDHVAARALHDESLSICYELGDRSGIARALCGLGVAARHLGDHSAARARLEESLAIYRELGDLEGAAESLVNLGQLDVTCGNYAAGRRLQEESLDICRKLGNRSGIAAAIEGLARTAFALGAPARATRMWGAMARLREEIGAPLAGSERHDYDRVVNAARARLGVAQFDAAWHKGAAMPLDQAISDALKDDDDAAAASAARR